MKYLAKHFPIVSTSKRDGIPLDEFLVPVPTGNFEGELHTFKNGVTAFIVDGNGTSERYEEEFDVLDADFDTQLVVAQYSKAIDKTAFLLLKFD